MTDALVSIAPGVWCVDYPQSLWGIRYRLPTRMTVLDLGDGLALHSPVNLDDATAHQIAEKGAVRWLINPNRQHGRYLDAARKRYPDAKVASALGRDVSGGVVLDAEYEGWPGALETIYLEGNPLFNETAFFHVSSKTLLLTDFLFNIPDAPSWTRFVLRTLGAWGGVRQPLPWRVGLRNRNAMLRAVQSVMQWPFERIVVCHGSVIDREPRQKFRGALAHWNFATQESAAISGSTRTEP